MLEENHENPDGLMSNFQIQTYINTSVIFPLVEEIP